MDDGTFIARFRGKNIRRSEGSSAVLQWDALGLVHLRHFFGGGFVLPCGAPHDLFIKCMTVRMIQPILHRNQTTLQHELIG